MIFKKFGSEIANRIMKAKFIVDVLYKMQNDGLCLKLEINL